MRNKLAILALLAAPFAFAQTTPNLGLALPPFASPNWNIPMNGNSLIIDAFAGSAQVLKLVTVAPTGSCTTGAPVELVTTTGLLYSCESGTWTLLGGSGTFVALTGDATSTANGGATEVIGLLNHLLPTLSVGYLNWNGTNWVLSAVSAGGVTNVATSTPLSGGPITSTGTISCPTCVVASSPGAGIAHFAGSTQTVTSSPVSLTADVSGILPVANGGNGTSSPGLVAGTNVTITGSWPTQTINSSGGGGGGTVSGQAAGVIPLGTSATVIGNQSALSDNGTNVTSTEPVVVNAGSASASITAAESTAPSGVSASDIFWPDSTAHRWKMNNNNAGALNIPGIASAAVAGDAATFASNGIDLVDGGALPVINAGLIGYGAYYAATGSALSQDSNFGHFNTTAVIADTDGASATQFSASGSGNGQVVNTQVNNCGTTGTTLNFLAKIINSSGACAVLTTTSDFNVHAWAVGAVLPVNGATPCAAGTTGTACLVVNGAATLTTDAGGATIGDYVGSSTTGASGTVTDLGTGSGLLTVNCIGRFLTTAAGGATATVMINDCPTYPASTGVTSFNTQTGAVTLASSGGTIAITNTGAAFNIDTVATAARLQVPGWLRFLGNGADGAFTCTTGTCTLGAGEHWYTSFNISSGAIAVVTASGGSIVRATGTCTIAGTMSVSGNTASGAGSGATGGWFGATGGGGGFGASNGTAAATIQGQQGTVVGGAAGTSGVSGGGGNTPTTIIQRGWLSGGWPTGSYAAQAFYYGGTFGGAGQGNAGSGGKGGGNFILVCGTINFTGTIDASGVNGVAGGSSTGGGGGGGGGGVIEAAITYTANTGTINVAGGNAGAIGTGTSTAGGAGATGVSASFTF